MMKSKKGSDVTGGQMDLFCQVDFLASHTAELEQEKAQMTIDTSGQKCLELLRNSSQIGSWAKTFTESLIGMKGWYSKKYKLTWKIKTTKHNRMYFQLAASELPTSEIEFGLLRGENKQVEFTTMPTPTAVSDPKGGCTRTDPKRQKDTLVYFIHGELGQPGGTTYLNPRFVAEAMGYPKDWLVLPFLNGETDQLQHSETQ